MSNLHSLFTVRHTFLILKRDRDKDMFYVGEIERVFPLSLQQSIFGWGIDMSLNMDWISAHYYYHRGTGFVMIRYSVSTEDYSMSNFENWYTSSIMDVLLIGYVLFVWGLVDRIQSMQVPIL